MEIQFDIHVSVSGGGWGVRGWYRIEYVYLSIKDAHDRQYNYMKITIFTLIGMIRLIVFNIQDIHIHIDIQLCNQ
jgi:hypothetical protein